MADKKPDKKGGKKDDKKPTGGDTKSPYLILVILIFSLFIISQLSIFVGNLFGFNTTGQGSVFSPDFVASFKRLTIAVISSLQAVAAFVSLLFLMGIIYAKFRIGQLKRASKLKEKVDALQEKKTQKVEETENKKWKKIVEHVSSNNPSDWRLSILEADILLSEVLKEKGYEGDTIGDMLKSAEKDKFKTHNEAWEAHKVRNSIAHEGSEFVLSQREAKRVITLFEDVFREFFFI